MFKDARVRLILIKNRRQEELENKMRIAEMHKTQALKNKEEDQEPKPDAPFAPQNDQENGLQ